MDDERQVFTTRFTRARDVHRGDVIRPEPQMALFEVSEALVRRNVAIHIVVDGLPETIAWYDYKPDTLIEIVVPA